MTPGPSPTAAVSRWFAVAVICLVLVAGYFAVQFFVRQPMHQNLVVAEQRARAAEGRIATLEADQREHDAAVGAKQAQLDAIRDELNDRAATISDLTLAVTEAQTEALQLSETSAEATARATDLQAQLDAAHEGFAELEARFLEVYEQNKELTAENDRLQSQLVQARRDIESSRARIDSLRDAMVALRADRDMLESQYQTAQAQSQELEGRLEQTAEELETSRAETVAAHEAGRNVMQKRLGPAGIPFDAVGSIFVGIGDLLSGHNDDADEPSAKADRYE